MIFCRSSESPPIKPINRMRTLCSCIYLTLLFKYSFMRDISKETSCSGRFQFSVEKPYTVRALIPISSAAITISFNTSAPARCPMERGMPLRLAHRPLPSIIIATCCGIILRSMTGVSERLRLNNFFSIVYLDRISEVAGNHWSIY